MAARNWTTIEAGKLRHYVGLERFVKVGSTARGLPEGQFRQVASNVPATVEPLSGRQAEIARQLVATATHRVTMRWRDGVEPKMVVTFQGRRLTVGHVSDGDFRKRYLELTCTEQVDGAT